MVASLQSEFTITLVRHLDIKGIFGLRICIRIYHTRYTILYLWNSYILYRVYQRQTPLVWKLVEHRIFIQIISAISQIKAKDCANPLVKSHFWQSEWLLNFSATTDFVFDWVSVTRFGGLPAKWLFFSPPGGQNFGMAGGGQIPKNWLFFILVIFI